MSPIDQHGELDHSGSPNRGEGIERCTHRAPGKENIINQHNYLVVDTVPRDVGLDRGPVAAPLEIIAIHRDIEDPLAHGGA